MKKTAVIYTRVSTDQQAEKGYSLRDQEDKLRRYCLQNDISILEHFQEDYSAKDFNRPEWKLLMAYLKKNKKDIDLFMFAKWDRFSRNMQESLTVLSSIRALGINIHCLENNVDESIPENKLIQMVMLLLPQIENERRSISVTAGMRRAMKEGKWPRQAPIGYMNSRDGGNRKIIIPNPEVSPLIKKAFNEMARGNKSQQEIRMELMKLGLKCSKNNFSFLLRNPFYMGKIFIPAYKDEHEEMVQGKHEAIVDAGVFYKVQEILTGRKIKKNVPARIMLKPELPLRGSILCYSCGNKMTGSASRGNGGRYYYYHCNECKIRYRAKEANTKFEVLLKQMTFKEEVKELFLAMVNDLTKESLIAEKSEQVEIRKEIKLHEERLQRLEDNFLDGKIDGTNYSKLSIKVESELLKLKERELEIGCANDDFNQKLIKGTGIILNMQNLYESADIIGKRQIVGSIFPRNFIFEENKVRTNEMNEVVSWIINSNKAFSKIEKGQPVDKNKLSSLVTLPGFEPRS